MVARVPFIVTDEKQSDIEMVDIIMALKELARDLNIPVILTVPLKADAPDQPVTYPCLSDIKEDCIVNMADVIILLHKVRVPNKKICKVDALIAKNRNGAQGVALFQFYGECLGFSESPEKEQTTLDMH